MNGAQRFILLIAALFFVAMLLYPPYHLIAKEVVINQGYRWIFSQPAGSTVNVGMLVTQWLIVLTVTGLAFFIAKTDPPN